jgi:hypothetical protein
MVKVRMKVSKEKFDEADQDRGDFVLPKPGVYVLQCVDVIPGFSKDADGNEDKKKPRLECIYKIVGVGANEAEVTENYGQIWDYISFSESSEWKRKEFLLAFGLADGSTDFDDDIDTDDCVNKKVKARLKHENGRNKDDGKRAKVGKLFSYDSDLSTDLADSATDYGSAFGDEEDAPVFGEDEGGDAAEPYTVDELDELDLKALGAILKDEFDGDPQACIVKKRGKLDTEETKAAVINAILEAQGDGDEGEGDEDPF